MPELKDLAALGTSWALTLWDALPIFLAIEAALAILVLVAVPARARHAAWLYSGALLVGGAIYLLAFESALLWVYPVSCLAAVTIEARWGNPADQPADAASIGAGVKQRAWLVVSAVARASFVAAVVKVLLAPYLADGNLVWFLVAAGAGLIRAGTFGTVAIPALAVATGTGSVLYGASLLAAAAARPLVYRRMPRFKRAARVPAAGN